MALPKCTLCPLEANTQVKDEINGSLILFVGIAPGYTEEKKGRPFIGKSGRLLRNTLRFVGIKLSSVSFANLVHCFPQDWEGRPRDPSLKEIKACEGWLLDTITQVKPKYIVLLGKVPTEWCFGRKVSITKVAGKAVEATIGRREYTVFPLPHPAYITRNMRLLQSYRIAFQRLADFVTHKEPTSLYTIKRRLDFPDGRVFLDIESNHTKIFNKGWELLSCAIGNIDGEVLDRFDKAPLVNNQLTKIGHNIKFDLLGLRKAGVVVQGNIEDIMLAHYLATGMVEGKTHSHSLKAVAREYGVPVNQVIEVDIKNMSNLPKEELLAYNRNDVGLTTYLYKKIPHDTFAYRMLCSSLPMLVDMEWGGMLLDTERVEKLHKEYEKRCEKALGELRKQVGTLWGDWIFNPNSNPQVVKVLTKLGIPLPKTAKDNPSTKRDVLEKIDHPFCKTLLNYRRVDKVLSTYLSPYLGQDRLHTTYNSHITDTGRLSSAGPNLQNIPTKSAIRSMFIAPEGYKFVSADYSQIEPRVWGALSGEDGLLSVPDIYTFMFEKTYNRKPTKEERDILKIVVLGTMYGMGVQTRAEQLHTTEQKAQRFVYELRQAFPLGFAWMDRQYKDAKNRGRVDIECTGRWRDLTREPSYRIRKLAINTPIQGTASDINLVAGREIYKERLKGVQLCNLVHDETCFYIAEDILDERLRDIKEIMLEAPGLILPKLRGKLRVDIAVGNSWGELQPYKDRGGV